MGSGALKPNQFASRAAYRKELIACRQKELAKAHHETLAALTELDVHPRGGKIGRTVVIEGTVSQVLSSLELPGVAQASLDRKIGLIQPRKEHKGRE